MNFELIKAGYLPVNIKFSDRIKYYNAFDEYRISGSADQLAGMIADYEAEELKKYIDIIEQK